MALIYLVAGESSGDVLGGRLMAALAASRSDIRFAGVGGPAMAAHGLVSLFPMGELALMGLLEVLPRLRQLGRRLSETRADIARLRPDAVVTIDSPGFTLRLLKAIRPLGIPRAHYVAPQVWAWREGRVRQFPGLWETLLCLLPFEPAFFVRHGLSATFVGHPVLESGADRGDRVRFRATHGIAPETRLVTVMPGSRRTEVGRLLPVFGETIDRLADRIPHLKPVVPVAGPVRDTVIAATKGWRVPPIVLTDEAEKADAFAASDAALTKSGTSTLELALAGVPMVVAYKANPLTAAIFKRMVKVRYASLLNLLPDEEVVPELLQDNCTSDRLIAVLGRLLTDPQAAEAQRGRFNTILGSLRPPEGTASRAAAAAVLRLVEQP